MLLIVIPDQFPNYCKVLEIYTGYFDSMDIMILFFSYPSSIVITRDYCVVKVNQQEQCYVFALFCFRTMHAFELDAKRVVTMDTLLTKPGVTCAKLHNQDFLTTSLTGYSTVEYAIVDPSCSGSGKLYHIIIHRIMIK